MFSRIGIIFFTPILMLSSYAFAQKEYKKNYSSKVLISEGWRDSQKKIDFWKFYYQNGKKKSEGHYCNGKKCEFWTFYFANGKKSMHGHYINGKKAKWWTTYNKNTKTNCQYSNNQKNGFCYLYKNKKLFKAEKYKNGKKLDEWIDLASFKRDNS